jgi:hypothetical protein
MSNTKKITDFIQSASNKAKPPNGSANGVLHPDEQALNNDSSRDVEMQEELSQEKETKMKQNQSTASSQSPISKEYSNQMIPTHSQKSNIQLHHTLVLTFIRLSLQTLNHFFNNRREIRKTKSGS